MTHRCSSCGHEHECAPPPAREDRRALPWTVSGKLRRAWVAPGHGVGVALATVGEQPDGSWYWWVGGGRKPRLYGDTATEAAAKTAAEMVLAEYGWWVDR